MENGSSSLGICYNYPHCSEFFNARRGSTHNTSLVLELNSKISNPTAHESSQSVVGYFLLSVAKGKTNEIQDWRELQRRFHVFVTKEISAAHDFFCDGLEPHDPFPRDRR
jgi:hypothetical protein